MKKAEIAAGKIFTDGKGRYRLVIALGPQFKLYDSQSETDCLQYRSAVVLKRKGVKAVAAENSTRASFAAWAKREVVDIDLAPEVRQALALPALA